MPHAPHLAVLPRPRTAVLRDGTRVSIRPLVREDRALVADVFEHLSPQSRFLRFHTPVPALSARALDGLTAIDHDRHVALVAIHDGVAVGIARYVRFDRAPATADVGISVVDAMHGRGLGRALLDALRAVAAERGVAVLHFDIHPEN